MDNVKPFIHLFKTANKYYVYDVNTDELLETDFDVFDYLKNGKALSKDGRNKLSVLQKNGYLSENRAKHMQHPDTEFLNYYLNSKLHMLVLQVTQNCNLRCDYCIFSGNYNNRPHSNKSMSFETAKKGIDFLIKHSTDCDKISVCFYGGEPLLNFNLIKKCVIYAESAAEGKKVGFYITSNATLINEEILDFFVKHDMDLLVSLDGPREIQNKNRKFANSDKGSFDIIYKNLNTIRNHYPDYYKNKVEFNMVIDSSVDFKKIDNFVQTDPLIKDSFFNSSLISQDYIKNNYDVDYDFIEKSRYELFKSLLNRLNRLDQKYLSPIVDKQLNEVISKREHPPEEPGLLPETINRGGPCVPGATRLFLSADGVFYPCERVSEESEVMKIGTVDSGIDVQKTEKLLNIARVTEKQCLNCWAFRYCTSCAKAADDLTEFSEACALENCNYIRAKAEEMLKNYCMLEEFGYQFDDFI